MVFHVFISLLYIDNGAYDMLGKRRWFTVGGGGYLRRGGFFFFFKRERERERIGAWFRIVSYFYSVFKVTRSTLS